MKVEIVNCQRARRCRPSELHDGDQIAYLQGHDGDWDIYQAGIDPETGEVHLHRIPDGAAGPPKGPDAYLLLPTREQVRGVSS
jgi:hypothetical protein